MYIKVPKTPSPTPVSNRRRRRGQSWNKVQSFPTFVPQSDPTTEQSLELTRSEVKVRVHYQPFEERNNKFKDSQRKRATDNFPSEEVREEYNHRGILSSFVSSTEVVQDVFSFSNGRSVKYQNTYISDFINNIINLRSIGNTQETCEVTSPNVFNTGSLFSF